MYTYIYNMYTYVYIYIYVYVYIYMYIYMCVYVYIYVYIYYICIYIYAYHLFLHVFVYLFLRDILHLCTLVRILVLWRCCRLKAMNRGLCFRRGPCQLVSTCVLGGLCQFPLPLSVVIDACATAVRAVRTTRACDELHWLEHATTSLM